MSDIPVLNHSLNLLILGNNNIGKSSLIMTLLMSNYDSSHVPSIVAPFLILKNKYNTDYDIYIIDSKKEDIIKKLKVTSINNNNNNNSNYSTATTTNKRVSTIKNKNLLFHPLDYIDCIVICIDQYDYLKQLYEWKNILAEIFPYGKRNSLIISVVLLKSDTCEPGVADMICKDIYEKEFTFFEYIGNVSCKYPESVTHYFLTLFHKMRSPISPLFTPEKV